MESKAGRPSKAKQLQIQKLIQPYFNENLSARFVSQLPNMPNEKTIQKYFSQWTKEISENLAVNFHTLRKNVIGKSLLIFDKQIYNAAILLNDLIQSHHDLKEFHEFKNKQSFISGDNHPEPFKPDLKLIKTIIQLNDFLADAKDHKITMEINQFNVSTEEQTMAEISEDRNQLMIHRDKINEKIRKIDWVKNFVKTPTS